jgi:hypothetical protein
MFLVGCSKSTETHFKDSADRLKVQPKVADALWNLKIYQGAKSEDDFDIIRAFFVRRQIAYRRDSSGLPPILSKKDIKSLLGDPHELDESGHWLYYVNTNKDWHIRLEFRDEKLFNTGFRKLIHPDNLVDYNFSRPNLVPRSAHLNVQ